MLDMILIWWISGIWKRFANCLEKFKLFYDRVNMTSVFYEIFMALIGNLQADKNIELMHQVKNFKNPHWIVPVFHRSWKSAIESSAIFLFLFLFLLMTHAISIRSFFWKHLFFQSVSLNVALFLLFFSNHRESDRFQPN